MFQNKSVTVVCDIFHTITMENAARCEILFDVPLVFCGSHLEHYHYYTTQVWKKTKFVIASLASLDVII